MNDPEPAAPTATEAPAVAPNGAPNTWLVTVQSVVTPLGLLLAALVLFGLYLRLYDFGYPTDLQFDEHHFVENARNYLKHEADWNDHPPLGKLLIAVGIQVIGDSSVGFRVPSLLSGLMTLVFGAWAAKRLFPSKWAAPLAAALLSADGFLIAYSRAALLDGFLVTASVAAILLTSFELSLLWACAAGLVFGLAVSVKFSGLGVLLPLLFCIAVAKREPQPKVRALLVLALVGLSTYVAAYALGLSMTDKPSGPVDVVNDTLRLLKHHADLTDMKHPVTSGWVTWMLPTKPVFLGISEKHGSVRALTTLGNLATWWSAVGLALLSSAVVLRLGWLTVLSERRDKAATAVTAFVLDHGKAVITLLVTTLGFLAPWIMTHRDSYIYHFLPAYAPIVLLLAGFLTWSEARWPLRVLGFTALVVIVAAFYAPLWAYVPLTRDALELRLFLPSWR